MSIYTSEKTLSYVYRLDNPITGEFYFGYRSANKKPSHQDLPKYKTSSKLVKSRFGEFDWTILAEFFIDEDAYDFEQLTIFENWNNPLILNNSCYYGKARLRNNGHSEETKAKMSASHTGKAHSVEHRANLSVSNTGKTRTVETKAKMSSSRKGRCMPPTSDETKSKMSAAQKGKKKGPPSAETKVKISASNTGQKRTEESKKRMSDAQIGNIKPKVKCPHCDVIGGGGAMKQWHFDRCKLKDISEPITNRI